MREKSFSKKIKSINSIRQKECSGTGSNFPLDHKFVKRKFI